MKIIKLCLVILAVIAFISACNQSKPANTEVKTNAVNAATPASPSTPVDDLATGRKLFADNCTICHKDTGVGGKVTVEGKTIEPANLTSDKIKNRTDEKLLSQIKAGSPDDGMPAFKTKLTDEQIKEVVKYVRKELQKM